MQKVLMTIPSKWEGMGQYLVENNVISNFFSGNFTEKGMDFIAEVLDQTPTISVITEIEALSWINPDKSKEQSVLASLKREALNSGINGLGDFKLSNSKYESFLKAVIFSFTKSW